MIKIPLVDDVLKGLPGNVRLRSDLNVYVKGIDELEAEIVDEVVSRKAMCVPLLCAITSIGKAACQS